MKPQPKYGLLAMAMKGVIPYISKKESHQSKEIIIDRTNKLEELLSIPGAGRQSFPTIIGCDAKWDDIDPRTGLLWGTVEI